MKYALYILTYFCIQFSHADEYKPPVPIQSDKLQIIGVAESTDNDGSFPPGWLRFYEHQIRMGHENVIPLTVKFDINNVQSIVLTDINATENKCGWKQKRHLLHLFFSDPKKNQHTISTRITKPCIVDRKATFKLSVKTSDDNYFYNLTTLTASSYAFSHVFHADYE